MNTGTRAPSVPWMTLYRSLAMVRELNIPGRKSELNGICAGDTDYFDLYLIHSPLSGKEKRLGTWRALLDVKKAGKVKLIGVSN